MTDIYVGLAIIGTAATASFAIALRLTRPSLPLWWCNLLGIINITAVAGYIGFLWDNVVLALWMPVSNIIVLGNWLPLFSAFLAGIVFQRGYGNIVRRGFAAACLAVAGVFASVHPLLGDPPACDNVWKDGVCLQTSARTCSAACATTLLHEHGIETTEGEMARLCLTRDDGTTWAGLYHGLAVMTRNMELAVQIETAAELDQLRALNLSDGPLILSVGLTLDAAAANPIYQEAWGWSPGQMHTVVLYGFVNDDRVSIGDPSVGREEWTIQDLDILWQRRGMRLVR